MPINRKGGSYDVSEAERLQQASLSRRAQPRWWSEGSRKRTAMSPNSAFTARHRRRTLLGTLLGVAVLSAGLLGLFSRTAPASHAAIGGCRSDPVVILSNGNTLHLRTVINDTTTDVQQVSYTLHAPVGTWITGVADTSDLDLKETLRFYADNPPSTYRVAAKVKTLTPRIRVTATMDVVTINGASTASASGQSQRSLWMDISQ
jgi:hypothetical protein